VRQLRRHYDKRELVVVGISSNPAGNAELVSAGANEAVNKGSLYQFLEELVAKG
jgi:hypothetical protein